MADDTRYMGFWIGHLHEGERNRIHAGSLNPQEREMLAKGEDPWAKFRGPLPPSIPPYVPPEDSKRTKPHFPSPPSERSKMVDYLRFATGEERKWLEEGSLPDQDHDALIAELQAKDDQWRKSLRPSRQELLVFTTEDNRKAVRFGRDTPELWRDIDAEWRRAQIPGGGVRAASNLPPPSPDTNDSERERARKGLEALHSLIPPPPEKPKQLGQLLADMAEADQPSSPSQSAKPKPYTQTKHVSKEQMAKLLRGENPWPKPEEESKQTKLVATESHGLARIPKVLQGGLFALFFGLVVLALQSFGVITVNWGHIFMLGATVVGVVILCLELIPGKPTKHKIRWSIALVVAMAAADLVMAVKTRPTASPQPNALTTTSSPFPAAPPAERVFVDVQPEYLVGLYQKYNSVQADEAVKTYIGKWIRISGSVTDVDRPRHFRTSDSVRVSMFVDKPGSSSFIVLADFSDARGMDRALILNKRETVLIEGRIDQVLPPGITLHDCKIAE